MKIETKTGSATSARPDDHVNTMKSDLTVTEFHCLVDDISKGMKNASLN